LGALTSMLIIIAASSNCGIFEPCDSYRESTVHGPTDDSRSSDAAYLCKRGCQHNGKEYDTVKKEGSDQWGCYCCK